MRPETLKHIKDSVRPLYNLANELAKFRDYFPGYMVVAVLLQNAATDSSDCSNYNHETEVKELHSILDILASFANYEPNDSFYQFIYKEYKMILDGYIMSEAYEEAPYIP